MVLRPLHRKSVFITDIFSRNTKKGSYGKLDNSTDLKKVQGRDSLLIAKSLFKRQLIVRKHIKC